MTKEHNGKIYFPHYEETLLANTLTAMVKSMQETEHLYYVEWNGKFYYSDEVKIDGNLVMCEGKMNKKLTDEEIIASLENCNSGLDDVHRHSCATCPYREIEPCGKAQMTDCLDLIRRQKAENLRLSTKLGQILLSIDTIKEMNTMCSIDEQKKQAVKEFAEKLKDRFKGKFTCYIYSDGYTNIGNKINDDIDELLKEYENEQEK